MGDDLPVVGVGRSNSTQSHPELDLLAFADFDMEEEGSISAAGLLPSSTDDPPGSTTTDFIA